MCVCVCVCVCVTPALETPSLTLPQPCPVVASFQVPCPQCTTWERGPSPGTRWAAPIMGGKSRGFRREAGEAPCLLEVMSIPSPYPWPATLRGSTSGQASNPLFSSFSQRSVIRGGMPGEHTFLGLLEITPTREPRARLCGLAHQDCLLRAVKTGPGNQGSVVIMLLICWGF